MQKIQFYLVPNRIVVTTDRTGFNTEFRQVYQRKIKLYKGIDNSIQLDIRNSEQRKQAVVGYTADLLFFDTNHKKLFEVTATAISTMPGQMTAIIPAASIANVTPQNLLLAVRLVDSGSNETPLYIDGQFALFGSVEIADGYNERPNLTDVVTVFNYEFDANAYISEMAHFGTENNEDVADVLIDPLGINVEIYPQAGFNGVVEAWVTNDMSTASSVKWTKIADWSINAATHVPATNTFRLTGTYRFIRFKYSKYTPVGTTTLTGMLDKIIVRH